MRDAALLAVGIVWQFSMLAGQQWAAHRGIGNYPGYSLRQYMKDIPPATATMPPYWAERLSDPVFSGFYATAMPTPAGFSPLETGIVAAYAASEMNQTVGSLPIEFAIASSTTPVETDFSALHFVGYACLLLAASLFVFTGWHTTTSGNPYQLRVPKKPTIITKKEQQSLPTELELSSAAVIPAGWYPQNIPLPASPIIETPYISTSMSTQTTAAPLSMPPIAVVFDSPPINSDVKSASTGTQTTNSPLARSTISTVVDTAPAPPTMTTSTSMQTEAHPPSRYDYTYHPGQTSNDADILRSEKEKAAKLLKSMDDQITRLENHNQQLEANMNARLAEKDTNMNAKLIEMAQMRAALTISQQQVRQAQAQGFVINQEQYRGSGFPYGSGVPQGGFRDSYQRGGGSRGGKHI